MLPKTLQSHIEEQLDANILSARSVSGGSINQSAKVEIEGIGECFLKWNTSADPDIFEKEAQGLKLLAEAKTDLVTPEVIVKGKTEQETGFLLLEYLKEKRAGSKSAQFFGENLAKLHRHTVESFGLSYDNYIGKLPQSNAKHNNWIDFFIKERIEPQLKMAEDSGYFSSSNREAFLNLLNRLPDIFPDEPPSLLHGDLWDGNYFFTTNDQVAIFDPAVYYGNREIELAFTHLFGGFSPGFYETYNTSYPIEPGFKNRIDIYNLYPLLVHTNLFGNSYASQVKSIINKFK